MNHIIILAGGKGTRMKSDLPKVLTLVRGVSIIERLLANVKSVCEKPTIIIGHKGGDVMIATKNHYHYVLQEEQRGTGHAIHCAKESLNSKDDIESIIVLPGDHPLVSAKTILGLVDQQKKAGAVIALATLVVPSYEGEWSVFEHYGRIVKDVSGNVTAITEFKDASEDVRTIKEVNLSYYSFDPKWLWKNIEIIDNKNVSGEYYLTDLVAIAKSQNKPIVSHAIEDSSEAMGINTLEQLKIVEEHVS